MLERDLQDAIVEMANLLGWSVFHTRPARSEKGWRTAVAYQGAGFPDVVAVRDRVLFAEIKAGRNTLRPEQVEWKDRLILAGAEWYLWNEKDWDAGLVEKVLR